jgi:hypothetical protein
VTQVITEGGENRYKNLYEAENTYSQSFIEYVQNPEPSALIPEL